MPWNNIMDYWPLLILIPFVYLRRRLLPIGRAIHFIVLMTFGLGLTLFIYPSLSERHQLYAIGVLLIIGVLVLFQLRSVQQYRQRWKEWQGRCV